MDTPKKKPWAKYLLLFIGSIIVLNIIIFSNSGEPVSNPAPLYADPIEWAGVYAQVNVQQNLKAPSTAKFPSLRGSVTDLGDNRFRVSSYVDSQNSFGAMIRSPWEAIMKYLGNNAGDAGNWKVETLIFDGKTIF